jgi:ribose transport system permease protein
MPVWFFAVALIVCAVAIAPRTLGGTSLSSLLPLATFLSVAALGQMLVIMTGGIDLSVPAVVTMTGTVLIKISPGTNADLGQALLMCLALAVVVGGINGVLVGHLGLNPLVVTIATGQIVLGLTTSYRSGLANETGVPPRLATLAASSFLGVSWIFWFGIGLTLLVAAALTRTVWGRRFQLVGANRRAAWVAGLDVRRYTVAAYLMAAVIYAVAGILLASFLRTPTLDDGTPYLLAPIAVVVIAGASLSGGLASAVSTWCAGLALALLTQMLQVMGLPTALQYLVFGIMIIVGMVVSGDRIVMWAGRFSLRPGRRET